jgi:uncharacterized membrane protein
MINILATICMVVILSIMYLSLRCDRWEETMRDSEEEK